MYLMRDVMLQQQIALGDKNEKGKRESMRYIDTLREGDRISEVYLCRQKQTFMTKAGKPYDSLILQDKTGTLDGKIWDVNSNGIAEFEALDYILVMGDVISFQGNLQLNIKRVQKVNSSDVNSADYLPVSQKNIPQMYEELTAYIGQMTHPYIKKLAESFFMDEGFARRFQFHSAAKSVHHGFVGGLLEHTLSVFKLCRRLADQYPELDRQTLLAGALFHDFGKIREFSGGIANDYTDEGRLLGHLEICVEMLAPYLERSGLEPELQRHLKHLVLSHHGTLEFGAVRVPQTAEALVLHYADNIDAKMAQCRGLFAQLGEGESWTPYQATLGRAMHRCAQTPVEEKVEKKPRASRKSSGEDGMLSLL